MDGTGRSTWERGGVIYRRTDRTGSEKPYVGQVQSEQRYRERQTEHARSNPDAVYEFKVIDRGVPGTELDVKEEYWIRQFGGPTNKSNPDGGLSNRKHQMNERRF